MASLKPLLPPAKSTTTTSFYDHSNAPWFKNRSTESEKPSVAFKAVPPYLKRQGYPEEFGDGGAFPEIHVVQYPLGMGKNKSSFCPQPLGIQKKDNNNNNNDKSNEHELLRCTIQDFKYVPSQQSSSGAKERIIRMVETPVDPLVPPKFKHKRVPKPSSSSPPVPVIHSPPRPVTVKDQEDWKIPPCVSIWKNAKGYVIPLDKRLAADGRDLQEVPISDGFVKLSEAMYVAEEKAGEAVSMRCKVRKEMAVMEKERREEELRALAQKARSERTGESVYDYDHKKIREERGRERRLEGMGKTKGKISRDRDRDVSERVALGMASTGGKGGEVVYDQRLFNQEKGMYSGFASDDDQYNVYDKGLFTAQPTLSMMCKPMKDTDEEMYVNVDTEQLKNTERFKPDKGFTRAASERLGKREREEEDPFGLERFVSDVKRGKKALDKIGSGGTMRASGSSSRDDYGGSGRTKISFERGCR